MANENIIKNIANEITRNCNSHNVYVDTDFVVYIIELMLLNPRYGCVFAKTINRISLESFVKECVKMLIAGETSIHTLKIQHIMQTNYDKLSNLVDRHQDSIEQCLRPLVNEILEARPDNEAAFMKLFRKISIFIILSSGLGNPGVIVTLKEGMAALESVFSLDDLKVFVELPCREKLGQLRELVEIVSGVRLFNRDCGKGGEGIPDLPFNIVDAGKACIASLSNALIAVMQRVNSLTALVADAVTIQPETGNILIDTRDNMTKDHAHMFNLLVFHRQYEVYVRRLLSDVEVMVGSGGQSVDGVRQVLGGIHAAVKYKAAVPIDTVYPLFKKLWSIWRTMQNIMYLLSTINRLQSSLTTIQDLVSRDGVVWLGTLEGLRGRADQEKVVPVTMTERLCLAALKNYVTQDSVTADRHVQYLGFCALCLSVGALVPSNGKVGYIKHQGQLYGFCSVKMAIRFSKEPERYINEVLNHARNNPHVINFLNLKDDVAKVKDVENLVTRIEPKIKVMDKDIQTDTHPLESLIIKDYSWDLWEWKRRACQWANIVNCKTHSTQTEYSHLRSEICCQTVEPRNKGNQTMKETGTNTSKEHAFIWGLQGRDHGQHVMRVVEEHTTKQKALKIDVCTWPCIGTEQDGGENK